MLAPSFALLKSCFANCMQCLCLCFGPSLRLFLVLNRMLNRTIVQCHCLCFAPSAPCVTITNRQYCGPLRFVSIMYRRYSLRALVAKKSFYGALDVINRPFFRSQTDLEIEWQHAYFTFWRGQQCNRCNRRSNSRSASAPARPEKFSVLRRQKGCF